MPKTIPTSFQIKKMSPEKQRYWKDRIRMANEPAYYRALRNIQLLGARNPAPSSGSRQNRRAEERREFKMPLGTSSADWQRRLDRGARA